MGSDIGKIERNSNGSGRGQMVEPTFSCRRRLENDPIAIANAEIQFSMTRVSCGSWS